MQTKVSLSLRWVCCCPLATRIVTSPFRLIAAAVLRMSVRGIVQEEALGVLPVRVCACVCLWERSYTIETFSFLPPSRDYRIVSVTLYPFASFFFSFSFLVRACVTRCDIISRFFLSSFRLCWCFVVQVAYCGNNGSSCLKSCRKRRLPSNEEWQAEWLANSHTKKVKKLFKISKPNLSCDARKPVGMHDATE